MTGIGPRSAMKSRTSSRCKLMASRIQSLDCFESRGEHFFADLGRAVEVLHERALGASGFDHHDGDVGVD